VPDHTAQPQQRRLVFKPPRISLVVLAFLVVCESTVALAAPGLWLLYLIPVAGAVWVLRTRTVVDLDTVTVRRVFTRRSLSWAAIASLRLRDRRWVSAVLTDGAEITLPEVRARHLPVLAMITGGRIADPTEPRAAETTAAGVTDTATESAASPESADTSPQEAVGESAEAAPAGARDAADAPVIEGHPSDRPV
jgi:hypothetical protein